MPIRVTCAECGESFSVEDKQRGKRIRCKECGEFVEVAADDDRDELPRKRVSRSSEKSERPRASRPRDDDDRDQPARKRGMNGALIATLVAVGLGAIGVTVWLATKKKQAPQDAAPGQQVVVENPGPEREDPPKIDGNPAKDPSKAKEKEKERERPKGPPKPPEPKTDIEWKVEPDPLADALELPTGPGTINITGFSGQVVYPSIPSSFVCVAQKGPRGDVREVWNLHTMKKVGTVDAGPAGDRPALSVDGSMIAVQDPPVPSPGVSIWSVVDGKQIAKFPPLDRAARLSDMEFIGPNEFLTAMRSGQDHIYQVWDIKNGKELRRFKPEASHERNCRALSAGRKYFAMFSKKEDRIAIYDLSTCELAGEALMPQQILGGFEGLSFSPDGKSLVALYRFMGNGRINVWDLETGKMSYDHKFGSGLKGIPLNGHPIEWLDDGSGWFIHASLLVESKGAAPGPTH